MPNDLRVSTIPDMATFERRQEAPTESRRTLIIIVAVGAALVIAGFFFILMRTTRTPAGVNQPYKVRLDQVRRSGTRMLKTSSLTSLRRKKLNAHSATL